MMNRIARLWRNLTRKREVEDRLDDEIRSYVDLLEAEKIASGVAPTRARREALLEVGGIEQVKEQVREVRIGRRIENLASDLHQAWRTLGNKPVTTAVVLLSLAVGIGVNTTIFSWIQAVIFEPLPAVAQSGSYQNVEALTDTGSYPGLSWSEYKDLCDRVSSFQGPVGFSNGSLLCRRIGSGRTDIWTAGVGELFSAAGTAARTRAVYSTGGRFTRRA